MTRWYWIRRSIISFLILGFILSVLGGLDAISLILAVALMVLYITDEE